MQVMMQVGFYGHVRQYKNIQPEIDANLKRVLESGEYVQGPMLKQFEQELAVFHGMKHAVGTGNGTDAIWLALMAMGIGATIVLGSVLQHLSEQRLTRPSRRVREPSDGDQHDERRDHRPRPPGRQVRRERHTASRCCRRTTSSPSPATRSDGGRT